MTRKKQGETPGNAMASAAAVTEMLVRVGQTISRAEHVIERLEGDGIYVLSIRIGLFSASSGEHLIVVSADSESGRIVAFHAGDTVAEALRGLIARMENRTLKWKADEYAK